MTRRALPWPVFFGYMAAVVNPIPALGFALFIWGRGEGRHALGIVATSVAFVVVWTAVVVIVSRG